MKKVLIILTFVLSACGHQRPIATKFIEGPAQSDIDIMKAWTVFVLKGTDRKMDPAEGYSHLGTVNIKFMDGRFPCTLGSPQYCTGVYRPKENTLIVAYNPKNDVCLNSTSLAHEFIHVMLVKFRDNGDPLHTQGEYWEDALTEINRVYCEMNCYGFCTFGRSATK
jgi:hypothetical protein